MDPGQAHLGSMGISNPRNRLTFQKFFDNIFSVWLQPNCFICKKFTTEGILCDFCNIFEKVRPPFCLRCGINLPMERKSCGKCEREKNPVQQIRTQYWLNDSAQAIMHEIKFRSHYPALSFLASSHLDQFRFPEVPSSTWVVPIPLAKGSFMERGFNQSEILARHVGERTGLKVVPDALVKVRKTDRQSWLNTKERGKNLKGAFAWNPRYTPPPSVLLIDDIYTTGSTFKECGRVLRRCKVPIVSAWALFRTPKNEKGRF